MYRVMKICIRQDDELFSWCGNITSKANSLENAALFRFRNVMTACGKDPAVWTANERAVMGEVSAAAAKHGLAVPAGKEFFLSYRLLEKTMRDTSNPDFFAAGLPKQSAQLSLKRVTKRMKGYFAAKSGYKKHPEKFEAMPRLPRYHRSGGNCTAVLSNQDCVVVREPSGWKVKLPLTKVRVPIGAPAGRLMQAEVIPSHGIYFLSLTFDDGLKTPEPVSTPCRIAAMDIGVDNLASITANTGVPGLIINGGAVKAMNQWYNKRTAAIRSEQAKGGTEKFHPSPESMALDLERQLCMDDAMHKTASLIMRWLKSNDIDTFVCGYNPGWKTGSHMGNVNNQNFVQIPFSTLARFLEYLCAREGIRFVRQEESYTSKASFIDGDPIPVYNPDSDEEYHFSGHRRPTHYKGMYKKDGFRGLYVTKEGTIINADLNGSANTGRKAFPDLYTNVCFDRPYIVSHPDLERTRIITALIGSVSKSKQRRLKRKQKSIPVGIGLCE